MSARTKSGVGLIRTRVVKIDPRSVAPRLVAPPSVAPLSVAPPSVAPPSLDSAVAYDVGKHTLVAELARGGMGVVHLAVSRNSGGFDKLFAIKQLKPEYAQDENYVAMFLEEARLAAHLTHPNIVQTHEVGSSGQRHYIVMDYLDGRSLYDIVRHLSNRGGLPIGAHLLIIAEALIGLHYAHELRGFDDQPLRIVHRDFSPLNVFVTVDGQVKLIDFGIAKAADSSVNTRTGVLKGRLAYMAPEQAWGSEVDRRADNYAAGVMLWEAATGRRLWPGMSDLEILARLSREGAPRVRSVRPDAPEALVAICERAMAQEVDDRYGTALDLLADLEAHIASRDDKMTMGEIGALVGREFAAELRLVNAAIAEALASVGSGSRPALMPRFGLTASSGSHAPIVHEDLSRYWMHPWSRAKPKSLTALGAMAVSSPVIPASAEHATVEILTPTEHSTPAISVPAGPATGKSFARLRRYAGAAAISFGGSLVIFALLVSLLRDSFARASAARASSAHPAPVAMSAPVEGSSAGSVGMPSREVIEVALRVLPAAAQIVVDGAAVSGNPFFARYPKDGRVHHVLAFADGFEPKWRDVSFAADVAVDFTLERRVSSVPSDKPPAVPGVPTLQAPSPGVARAPVRAPRPTASELWRVFPTDSPRP